MENILARRFNAAGTPENTITGPAIAAASAITPTHRQHEITGTTAIATINDPYPGFQGTIVLVFTNANPGGVTTGGNIAAAKDPLQNTALRLTKLGNTWYPDSPLAQ